MNPARLSWLSSLRSLTFLLLLWAPVRASDHPSVVAEVDLCIYGGTSAGVIAAVQASRLGLTAVLLEPGLHLGGLTSGGLGATDIGNKAAIGGLSREFYRRVAQHYAKDSSWTLETKETYFARPDGGQARASQLNGPDATMWTFEPHVAEEIFWDWINETQIPVYLGQALESVTRSGPGLAAVRTSTALIRARMFIDASYEGDLMAAAGVAFTVGREANAQYDETLNGVRPETPFHQFKVPVDPYRTPGDPGSGLLSFVQSCEAAEPGSGDASVQAYNFRLCFTTDPRNRLPLSQPADYRADEFELLARYLEALVATGETPRLSQFWNPILMPNHKTDINNNGGFSTDFIGMNHAYPNASPAVREVIRQQHQRYMLGLLTFLATSPRVPEALRNETREWGPAADEFIDNRGWPHQLYIREARRMIAEVVMTEHHCRGAQQAPDSVGLAAYNMDSHNCRRIVKDGHAENEGDVQVPPMKPYPISYRAIIPRQGECENLLVPVCLSATHIAYGSIRMEPVFMILGQSAATAAAQAIREGRPLQRLSYDTLRQRLLADGQILAWQ